MNSFKYKTIQILKKDLSECFNVRLGRLYKDGWWWSSIQQQRLHCPGDEDDDDDDGDDDGDDGDDEEQEGIPVSRVWMPGRYIW